MTETTTVFKNGVYYVKSNHQIHNGDKIELTTSEFDFDAVEGKFEKDLSHRYFCEVEILDEDLSGYIPQHSRNGGAYGYATAVVCGVEEEFI